MPELPEVERARQAIEAALDREIVGVDDGDEWVCRPHRVGGRSTWWCSAEQS